MLKPLYSICLFRLICIQNNFLRISKYSGTEMWNMVGFVIYTKQIVELGARKAFSLEGVLVVSSNFKIGSY